MKITEKLWQWKVKKIKKIIKTKKKNNGESPTQDIETYLNNT